MSSSAPAPASDLDGEGDGGGGVTAKNVKLSDAAPASASAPTPGGHAHLRTRTALLLILLIFLSSLAALALVYLSFPQLEPEELVHVKYPTELEDAKQLGQVLLKYKDKYFFEVLGGVFVTYLFLQTFAIPGSIFLSIMSGYLFPFWVALLVICFCSATGASFCYLLSYLVGRSLIYKYFPERVASWSEKVEEQRDNILSYILFLRITPFLPNWFINIVSPMIDVDLRPFWLGTFFGVAPPSFIAIQAGTTLQQMTSKYDTITFTSVILLAVFAIISILPVIFRHRKSIRHRLSQCRRCCCCSCCGSDNKSCEQSEQQSCDEQQQQQELQDCPARVHSPVSSSSVDAPTTTSSLSASPAHVKTEGQVRLDGDVIRWKNNNNNKAATGSGDVNSIAVDC